MPYYTPSRLSGDPFIHKKLFKVARKALPFVGGVFGGPIGAAAGGVLQRRFTRPPRRMPGGELLRIPGGFVPPPATREQRLKPPPIFRAPGAPRKRRRMDPLNVKALRRATRRLAGFKREADKAEKALRKLAPAPRRRASRADLPPGHRHIR